MSESESEPYSLCSAKTGEAVQLAMQGLWLTGRVLPIGGRLMVAHSFRSAEADPVEAIYAFALPRDAALRRFTVIGDGFRVRSELHPVKEAREIYEKGINDGHLSTLAQAYRDGVVNLNVGNIRPGELIKVMLELVAGVDLSDDGFRFRFPFTLAPRYHAQARAVEVAPGVGEQEVPPEEFGDVLLPPYMTNAGVLHQVGFSVSLQAGGEIVEVGSPSHHLGVSGVGSERARVQLTREAEVPNRDLVLDLKAREVKPRTYGGWVGEGESRLTAVVPSTSFAAQESPPRSVVFILDRSGSMSGFPIRQARKAIQACLSTLEPDDRFQVLAFDDVVEASDQHLVPADAENRRRAERFLEGVDARGGTDMGPALRKGAESASESGAELFVVTDGQVMASEDILAIIRSKGIRLHCLGIGSASQDRFLTLMARQTGGVSRFVTPNENIGLATLELFAACGRPLAVEVKSTIVDYDARLAVKPTTVVFKGHPLVVMVEGQTRGQGALRIEAGRNGEERCQVEVPLVVQLNADAEIVRLLHGARLITDLEAMVGRETGGGPQEERSRRRHLATLEKLGRLYGLANRALSLVAVVERESDDPTQVPRTQVVPVGMPEDVSFDAYFRRARQLPRQSGQGLCQRSSHNIMYCMAPSPDLLARRSYAVEPSALSEETLEERLVTLAAEIDPDGGMPGDTAKERLCKSLAATILFLAQGSTEGFGSFLMHIKKLRKYLRDYCDIVPELEEFIERFLVSIRSAKDFPKEWADEARTLLESEGEDRDRAWDRLRQMMEVKV